MHSPEKIAASFQTTSWGAPERLGGRQERAEGAARPWSSGCTRRGRAQSSQNSLKPKANAKSQLVSGDKPRASCSATPPRRLAPMGMWPRGFLNPLSKSWPEEPLDTYIPLGASHFLSLEALSPVMSLVEGDKAWSSPPFCFK